MEEEGRWNALQTIKALSARPVVTLHRCTHPPSDFIWQSARSKEQTVGVSQGCEEDGSDRRGLEGRREVSKKRFAPATAATASSVAGDRKRLEA